MLKLASTLSRKLQWQNGFEKLAFFHKDRKRMHAGHKTLQMVERYSHQNGAHIQTAMDKLEQRYNLTNNNSKILEKNHE